MCGCRKSIKEQRPYIGLHCHCNLWLQLARHTWVKLLWLSLQAKYQKQASNHLRLKNDESMKHYIYFQLKFLHIPIYMIVDCRFVPVVCWSGFCLLLWHFVIWVNKQKVWNFQSYCIALLLFKVTFSKKKGMLDETFWDTIFFFSAFNSIIHNTYTHIYTLWQHQNTIGKYLPNNNCCAKRVHKE